VSKVCSMRLEISETEKNLKQIEEKQIIEVKAQNEKRLRISEALKFTSDYREKYYML
jgi:hypothetical protein